MAIIQKAISIPEPTNDPDALWRTTQALKETVEVMQGIRGNREYALLSDLDNLSTTTTTAAPAVIPTHTGEVTGDTNLTLDVTAITNRVGVVADAADDVAIHDDTDGAIKKVNLSSITDAGYF